MNTKPITAVPALVASILVASTAHAQPFTNGGFELPWITGVHAGAIPGWDVTKSEGRLWFGPAYGGFTSPAEGLQHFEIGMNDSSRSNSISQTFSTLQGQQYRVSFQVGWGGNDVGARKSVRASVVSEAGETLASLDANAPVTRSYGPVQSFTFVATTEMATLTFLETSAHHSQASLFLDNVRLEQLIEPEPCMTLVGGTIANQTWTKDKSPYCVTNDVYVAGNLVIREGVEVRVQGDYVFEVAGTLRAVGTTNEPITFHPEDPTLGWQGILFRDAVPGSFFVSTLIEGSKNSGVRITSTPPAFTNCVIRNNTSPSHGGGISAELTSGQLVLDSCVVTDNQSTGDGGGIWLKGAGHLSGCFIQGNKAVVSGSWRGGGGIYATVTTGKLVLDSCYITDNRSTDDGGGIILDGAGDFSGCHISRNQAGVTSSNYAGGGLAFTDSVLTMLNCEVSDNEAYDAAGMYVSGPAVVRQWNCKVLNNRATRAGGGLFLYHEARAEIVNSLFTENQPEAVQVWNSEGRLSLTNSIIFHNNNGGAQISGDGSSSTVVEYSNIQGKVWLGEGNLSVSPALCPNGSLIQRSPCIDAGHPGLEFRDGCLSHEPCTPFARGGARNDMGAYGGPGVCYWTEPRAEPVIRIAPVNTIGYEGQPVSLDVLATGQEVLTYRWLTNGAPVADQTNAVLVYANGDLSQAGTNYVVEVSNDLGTTASVPVHLGIAKFETRVNGLAQGRPRLLIRNGMAGEKCAIYSISPLALGDSVIVPGAAPNAWELRDTLTFTSTEVSWEDPRPLSAGEQRFYGVRPAP